MTLHLTDDEARMVREFVEYEGEYALHTGRWVTEKKAHEIIAMLDAKASEGKPSQGEEDK